MPPEEAAQQEELAFSYYVCPHQGCYQISVLEFKSTQQSTDGPMDIAKVRCVENHWFMMPIRDLEEA